MKSPFSSRVYARLLIFYPDDLRNEYGAEMALTFADDLAAARRDGGFRAALRVWGWTASEFLRFALLHRMCGPAVRVPAISLPLFAGMLSAFLPWGTGPLVNGQATFPVLRFVLISPLFLTPLVGLAALFACRSSGGGLPSISNSPN